MGKIIKNGIDYGGGVAVDSTLDATSMNAVANKPVAEAITQLNNDLSDFKFRNNNGVAEFSIDNGTTWQKLGGGGMPLLDFANPLHTFAAGTINYTVTQESYICGTLHAGSMLKINGKNYATATADSVADNDVYISPLKVTTGDVITGTISSGSAGYLHVLDVR